MNSSPKHDDSASSTCNDANVSPALDLSNLPPIFVLPTHLALEDLHDVEDQLTNHLATLTYDVHEAKIFLGQVATKKRAQLELRSRKLLTAEYIPPVAASGVQIVNQPSEPRLSRKRKRSPLVVVPEILSANVVTLGETTESDASSRSLTRKPKSTSESQKDHEIGQNVTPIIVDDSSTESEPETVDHAPSKLWGKPNVARTPPTASSGKGVLSLPGEASEQALVYVLKLRWLYDSISDGIAKPFDGYLVYQGTLAKAQLNRTAQAVEHTLQPDRVADSSATASSIASPAILQRARQDPTAGIETAGPSSFLPAPYGPRRFRDQHLKRQDAQHQDREAQSRKLFQHTTSEYEGANDTDLPQAPEWVKARIKYACQRVTPANPPNKEFNEELQKIKLARLLTGDEIGVRAYSSSIAAIASYPYAFTSAKEILTVPGCDIKIANLWIEWKNSGKIQAAVEAEDDESLKILRDFYNIWGVGSTTAREFYYDRGWRDRDDIVEYGWSTLSRVQQIGVKYYDEFLEGIPRAEVESIAAVVKEHAIKVRDLGVEVLVVGGYRRGKEMSGDVDMIVSHRDLHATAGLVRDIVSSLETDGWITHTLLLALTSTERQQSTLPFKSSGVASHGAGFDTLDKALVVWQDPHFDESKHVKNPNIHRRVDIIISPWRTVGCAVAGWSSGTTFQRDLRRYSRATKNWKFDSSGVRDRGTGDVVQLEGPDGVAGNMVDAEKKVFEGFGLVYREPWERCTG